VHALSDNIFVKTSLVTVVALTEFVQKKQSYSSVFVVYWPHGFFVDAPCENIFVKTSLVTVVAVTELVKRKSVRICQKSTQCGY
jgi:ABC-type amino acid transport system permease subunit